MSHPTSPAVTFPAIAELLVAEFTPIVQWMDPKHPEFSKLSVASLVWLCRSATAVTMVLVPQRNDLVQTFVEKLIQVC